MVAAGAPATRAARFFTDRSTYNCRNNCSDDASRASCIAGEEASQGSEVGGLDCAELPFPDDVEDTTFTAGKAAGNASSSRTAPQTEPTTEHARAALQRRRQLFDRCTALHNVVQEELRAEVARDMKDGVAAVPPLASAGWRVLHPTGSNYFTMTRVESGYDTDGRHAAAGAGAAAAGTSSAPRYRSVHDMMTGRWRSRPPSSQQRGTPLLHESARGGGGSGGVRYTRSETHITLFAPFRTLDLTLYDPRVDICEWSRFDVLVRKSKPATATTPASNPAHSSSPPHSLRQQQQQPVVPLQGQQEIWDEGRCMFLRLACVNSELRIRSVQFVSNKLARALEEHAVFGKGEPLYRELLRRQRRERVVVRAEGKDRWHTAASPLNVFDAPGSTSSASAASTVLEDPLLSVASADGANVLTSQFNRNGEYARTFAYPGPYLTDLSKELREALHEYVLLNLGITSDVAEYVCQMQFFLEQEEYIGWLAQWGQLASTLQKAL
ncbi:hypothetical protein ABL78_1167 [Leptomonas seymouri]|uniref:Uncharacterized protein n=1 Tax=Leptomonas seymouri TaxID=5684 RepID=A0A0N1I2J1_LEPSE|nr:hypothetical protein ABL78_1167 [Leptomonas seymouri]|eukprot:KPI89674.1 hypothetical protein ABL78_1167 [Leptomonas seymouri]